MPKARDSKSTDSDDAPEPPALRAFVLIQTNPGRVEAIIRSLKRMPAVLSVDPVTGPYDIVVLLGLSEVHELSQLVAGTIGGMRGVTRTTTLICA